MKIQELKALCKNNEEQLLLLFEWERKSMDKHFKNLQNEMNNRFGVLSLTRNPTNLLMWSHYANEHKGVVIGIDTSNVIFEEDGIMINTIGLGSPQGALIRDKETNSYKKGCKAPKG